MAASVSDQAAIQLLTRAVELDQKKRKTEALALYKEGLALLIEAMKVIKDEARLAAFRAKAKQYMNRAEQLQQQIEADKKTGKFHEQIRIQNDAVGNSYEALFGRFLDDDVVKVTVEDPYIRAHHQILNLLRLCELLVKKCKSLSVINVITSREPNPGQANEQAAKFGDLTRELSSRNVELNFSYSETLHDREIRLSPNGWTIKIGRGLDIYKPPSGGKFSLGTYDFDLRRCHETTVDIFHKSTVAQ